MVPARPIAPLLIAGLLAFASIDRAEASLLLPELSSIVTGESTSDDSLIRPAARPAQPEPVEPAPPIDSDLLITPRSSDSTTSSAPAPLVVPAGGAALPASTIALVGGGLTDAMQCEHRCGWMQLFHWGVFRPPRYAM